MHENNILGGINLQSNSMFFSELGASWVCGGIVIDTLCREPRGPKTAKFLVYQYLYV